MKKQDLEMKEVFTSVVVYRLEDDKEFDFIEQFDNVKQAKIFMKENGFEKWLWMACVAVNLSGDEFAFAKSEVSAIKKLNFQLEYYGLKAYDPWKCN